MVASILLSFVVSRLYVFSKPHVYVSFERDRSRHFRSLSFQFQNSFSPPMSSPTVVIRADALRALRMVYNCATVDLDIW